ncbi:MAG: hypothetical protein LC744_00100 [Chloroflexi bacterium]|jgi:hypothetical protein|nr:hypothetical protein [Chloroflexota bacterium]
MKLQLLRVSVQPAFVVLDDDGVVQEEMVADPVVVMAKDWARYVEETFPGAIAELQRRAAEPEGDERADPA